MVVSESNIPRRARASRATRDTLDVDVHASVTGSGVLISQKASPTGHKLSLDKRKREQTFQSDLPKHVLANHLPDPVCYRDIERFILKATKAIPLPRARMRNSLP